MQLFCIYENQNQNIFKIILIFFSENNINIFLNHY